MATNVALAMPAPDDDFESEEVVVERTFVATPPSAVPQPTSPLTDDCEFYGEEDVIIRTFDADGNLMGEESEG